MMPSIIDFIFNQEYIDEGHDMEYLAIKICYLIAKIIIDKWSKKILIIDVLHV